MKSSELKEKRIVTKDGHFMPLVFVGLEFRCVCRCYVSTRRSRT